MSMANMDFESQYRDYMQRQGKLAEGNPYLDFCFHPGKYYEHPFQIFGNLWYVGNKTVCMHLIDTGDGLLLFDTGAFEQQPMLIQAIWEAGFNPADVKWLIHAHAHVDHIGGAQLFKDMFGTQLLLGEPDARMMREHPGKTFIYDSHYDFMQPFPVDVEIHDGDVMTFGNTTVRFVMVPGHTEGCLCSFFDVTDGKEVKRAGYFGGYGFITLNREYLEFCGDSDLTMRRTFMQSLQKVRDEKVDIFLGNHPFDNKTIEKRQYMLEHPGENPFLNSDAFGEKMNAVMADLQKLIDSGK